MERDTWESDDETHPDFGPRRSTPDPRTATGARRKGCLTCGGTKPAGAGVRWCDQCLGQRVALTLEELVEDQRRDMARGDHIERERIGNGHTGERTLSLDALPVWRESTWCGAS
jgi:hypothetical protein